MASARDHWGLTASAGGPCRRRRARASGKKARQRVFGTKEIPNRWRANPVIKRPYGPLFFLTEFPTHNHHKVQKETDKDG